MSEVTIAEGVYLTVDVQREAPKKAWQEKDLILANRDTKYFVSACGDGRVLARAPGVQAGQNQVWKFILADAKNQNYYIRSVSENKYAFVDEPPNVGSRITLSNERRLWQVRPVPGACDHLAITPVGEKVGQVWWANLVPGENEQLTIQVPTEEKTHWLACASKI